MAAPNLGQGIDRGNYRRRNGITPPAVQGKAAGAVAQTVFFGTATGPVTHATTGALTGQGSAVVGSAARSAGAVTHATTGALTGPGSTVAGTAARTRQFATSGTLTGPGSTVAGASTRFRAHPTTGTLTGPGSTATGSAARFRAHPTTGTLTGPGSTVAGASARTRAHPTTGTLTGPGSTLAGSAARIAAPVTHATSGVLSGPNAAVAGSAARTRAHASEGALTGQASTLAGSAARTRQHATSGELTTDGAIIIGSATRVGAPIVHDTSGVLTGPGAIITGEADPELPRGSGGGGGVAAKGRKKVRSTYVRNTAKENLYAVLSQLDSDRQAEVVELVAPLAALKQPEAQRIAATAQVRSTELDSVRQLHADIEKLEQQLKSKRDSETEYATLRKMSLDLRDMIAEEEEFIESYSHVLAADALALLSIVGVRV